jgi:hypothetical protein
VSFQKKSIPLQFKCPEDVVRYQNPKIQIVQKPLMGLGKKSISTISLKANVFMSLQNMHKDLTIQLQHQRKGDHSPNPSFHQFQKKRKTVSLKITLIWIMCQI